MIRCWCEKNKKVPEMIKRSNQIITREGLFVGGRFVSFCDDGGGRSRKKSGGRLERKTEGGVVVALVMMLAAGEPYQETLLVKQHSRGWQCSKLSCRRSRTRSTKGCRHRRHGPEGRQAMGGTQIFKKNSKREIKKRSPGEESYGGEVKSSGEIDDVHKELREEREARRGGAGARKTRK